MMSTYTLLLLQANKSDNQESRQGIDSSVMLKVDYVATDSAFILQGGRLHPCPKFVTHQQRVVLLSDGT